MKDSNQDIIREEKRRDEKTEAEMVDKIMKSAKNFIYNPLNISMEYLISTLMVRPS